MVLTTFAPLLLTLAAFSATPGTSAMPRVDAGVHRALRQRNTVNVIVTMKSGVDASLHSVQEADFATRGKQIEALVASLEANAKASQKTVDALLVQEAGTNGTPLFESEESFWISNQKLIRGATFELVEKLAENPDIAEIEEEMIYPLPTIEIGANATGRARTTIPNQYGLDKVQAPTVWTAGFTGQGIVIGSIDTGVRATHTSIASQFRSDFGWFDLGAKRTTPYNGHGHGTHTIGTMVGNGGIGVAPSAQFIACRGCAGRGCSDSDVLACAQFMTCPTDATGTTRDCSKAPHVINNSWNGGQGRTFFAAAIRTWRAAGIVPVFGIGNVAPGEPTRCGSANSPGDDPHVISVGATDVNDALGWFSLKGPSKVGGLLKPEIAAPGVDVLSAWPTDDNALQLSTGTSMAAPHVTGVIALLLSKTPTLTYDQIKTAITTTTEKKLASTGLSCGKIPSTVFPNNEYGYGRINALAALNTI